MPVRATRVRTVLMDRMLFFRLPGNFQTKLQFTRGERLRGLAKGAEQRISDGEVSRTQIAVRQIQVDSVEDIKSFDAELDMAAFAEKMRIDVLDQREVDCLV